MTTDPRHIEAAAAILRDVAERPWGNTNKPESVADPRAMVREALALLGAPPVTPQYLAVYIGTTNDTNGNPRRGWYVSRLDGEGETMWIEEGYGNFPWHTFAEKLGIPYDMNAPWYTQRDKVRPYIRETGRIEVTPGEYRNARKLPRFGGAS